jgi:3-hydroxyacyl-[acyl-carrier-protein] dehydratase
MEIRFEEIKQLLPQKFPFLMVDRVVALEKGKSIVAIKNISGNEIHFLGHFPNMAIFPGALILEGLAQTAILLFRKSHEREESLNDPNVMFFFGAANSRFFHPVVPGDQLRMEVKVIKAYSTGGMVEGVASVDGKIVAKGELTFGVKRKEEMMKQGESKVERSNEH